MPVILRGNLQRGPHKAYDPPIQVTWMGLSHKQSNTDTSNAPTADISAHRFVHFAYMWHQPKIAKGSCAWVWRLWNFIFCWSCISLQILGNNQLDALFHVFIYFTSLHVPSFTALIIRRSNCINTSSGMFSLCKWLLGMPVRSSLLTGILSSHTD